MPTNSCLFLFLRNYKNGQRKNYFYFVFFFFTVFIELKTSFKMLLKNKH